MTSDSANTIKRRLRLGLVVLACACLLHFTISFIQTPILGTWCDTALISESENPSRTAVAVVVLYDTQDADTYALFIHRPGVLGYTQKIDTFTFDQFNGGQFENSLKWSQDGDLLLSPVQYKKKLDNKCKFKMGYELQSRRLLSSSQHALIQQHGGSVSTTWSNFRQLKSHEMSEYLSNVMNTL